MLGEFHGHRGLVGYTSWGYKESDEIKRHLLLGSKAMTNPDIILKSRDITLLTKVLTVKFMVFLVVMNGCWSIKKAEHQGIDAFKLQCWRRLFGVP